MSASAYLNQFGGSLLFEADKVVHVRDNVRNVVATRTRTGLYRVCWLPPAPARVNFLSVSNQLKRERVHQLHRCMGHAGINRMRAVLATGAVRGLTAADVKLMTPCSACALGKHVRKHVPAKTSTKADYFGQILSCDNTGCQRVRTRDGPI